MGFKFDRVSLIRSVQRSTIVPMYETLKRSVDLMGSIALFMGALPIFIIIPILIKLDSKGSVFFCQKRCGKNGSEFYMYKFRTMVTDAEELKKLLESDVDGPMFKKKDDPRVTRVGRLLRKYSLDELPQLINIFLGDMSIVGPRPLAAEEMEGNDVWRQGRLSVKPGLTGLWQVKGRSSHLFSDWIKYDLEYVRRRSPFFDLKIILMTVMSVLRRKDED